ncbi:MAG TPA: DUF1508 domain-containing protein [Gaiellaceae bacterium]|nr:DUF1508 domain-containing protein [Gaiellaceae bacterium]
MTTHDAPDGEHDQAAHARVRADPDRWNALPFVGFQDCFGLRPPGEILELRNCTCGSTLARRTHEEDIMKFEVYRDKTSEFRWRLLTANANVVADSGEGYTRSEDAHHAIANLLLAINDVVIVDA